MRDESSTKKESKVFIWIIVASILFGTIGLAGSYYEVGLIIILSAIIFTIFTTIYFSRAGFAKGLFRGGFIFLLHCVFISYWFYLFFRANIFFPSELDNLSIIYLIFPISIFLIAIIAGITRFISKKREN